MGKVYFRSGEEETTLLTRRFSKQKLKFLVDWSNKKSKESFLEAQRLVAYGVGFLVGRIFHDFIFNFVFVCVFWK